MSSNFRELEKKYGAITSIMSSQSQFISRLEKQCQCGDSPQSQAPEVGGWVTEWAVLLQLFTFGTLPSAFKGELKMACLFVSVPVWTGDECAAEDPAQPSS